MSDPLSDLFANVPLPWEAGTKVLGIEVPDAFIVKHNGPPIADPVAWLQRSRTIWHEIGHAIDYISESNEVLSFTPHGHYSSLYADLLEQHAALIVGLRQKGIQFADYDDGKWTAYASHRVELWAEAVAIACTKPAALKATKLWPVLYGELTARNISVPPPDEVGMALPCYRMKDLEESLPQTIYTILLQAGGVNNFTGALCAVGCCAGNMAGIRWRHPAVGWGGEMRGSGALWKSDAGAEQQAGGMTCKGPGHLEYDVGIDFPVNGKEGEDWRMAVTYEPCDTYSVWLWCNHGLLDSRDNVCCEDLDGTIDDIYTTAIRNFNAGVIPL